VHHEQKPLLSGPVISFDLAVGLRVMGTGKDMNAPHRLHVALESFLYQTRSVVEEQPGGANSQGLFKAAAFHMPATFKLSWTLRGAMEHLLMDYMLDTDMAHDLARLVTDYSLEIVDIALEKGADFVACEGDLAHNPGPLMRPEHYDEFIGPYHKELCDRVHNNGGKIIKHSDGNLTPLIPALLEAGFDGIHPIQPQCMDIGETKRDFGAKTCLLGNIDCSFLLVFGSPDDVRKSVKDTIAKAAPGGGYIMSSSNSIHPGCKPENYLAMVEAGREYGRYS